MSDNVYELNGKKREQPKAQPGVFEFHFFPAIDSDADETTTAEGYLKFGPQFIAVTTGAEDESPVAFACATNILKYVKKISEGAVQATLAL